MFQKNYLIPILEIVQLKEKDKLYINEKGLETIRKHTEDFIKDRLSPSIINNDGKQTPTKGHPTFIAQHATATCCRGCLYKWHHIPKGVPLTSSQQEYIVNVIMSWIDLNIKKQYAFALFFFFYIIC